VYVWFEAVLGYLSAFKEWARRKGDPSAWKKFWKEPELVYYVHGKDNIPFHTTFLFALILSLGFNM
jgi:methionyl-tRNA synthetase